MPTLIHGLEVWGRITETEMKKISKIHARAFKQILHLPKLTPNIGILFETRIWPVKERIEYSTIMLFHSVINSDDEGISKKIIKQQQKKI